MQVYLAMLILAGVLYFAERAGKSARARKRAMEGTGKAPAPQAKAPPAEEAKPVFVKTPEKTEGRPGFISMEDRSKETQWHETRMTGEGTDPCHDEMYADPSTAPHHAGTDGGSEEAREWARAVVMAEILKRPSERRRCRSGR